MGITTWKERSRFGLSLTLGGGEVKMIDMAVLYGTMANQGLKVDLHPILKVESHDGKILQDFDCDPNFRFLPQVIAAEKVFCEPKAVLNPQITYQITDILSDDFARSPAFGLGSLLNIPGHQVAVKTGTTNEKRDNWTIGYTNQYLVATWVGNNNNTPMNAVASGITGATPIWNMVMSSILVTQDFPSRFIPPSDLVAIPICATNGLLPCSSCPNIKTEYFLPGTEPMTACIDPKKEEVKKPEVKTYQEPDNWAKDILIRHEPRKQRED